MRLNDQTFRSDFKAAGRETAGILKNEKARARPGLLIRAALGALLGVVPVVSTTAQTRPQVQTASAAPSSATAAASTQTLQEEPGKTSGNYNIQQSVEFGYRDSLIDGNLDNYNSFENLNSGVRLFNYNVDIRSINHEGIFFDNLSFSNFGYGGDPNDVSRLRIDKNKWYAFRALYRRDKEIWNYNLLANPLNPASFNPAVPVVNSPHSLNLSRRMQDYDLTVLPKSRVSFRLGYSRNIDSGPAATTLEGGTDTILAQSVRYTTNAYRMGVDYRGISRTTLSFDESLIYSKVDNSATDNNFLYQLSNGTPVDLALVFTGSTPCAKPVTNAATAPPTVTSNCNGFLAYSQVENPRSSFPTERFSFESSYVRNLSMTGLLAYSSGSNSVTAFNEAVNSWTSRTVTRGGTTSGPTLAKRISVDADWTGDYRFTDKLNLTDAFSYENWRIPSMWATADTNLFATRPTVAGQTGLALPIAVVTPATFATVCPTAPYNGPSCPQHASGSLADVTNELVSQFLGQNIRSNTVELRYDLTRRVSAYVGYLFTARTIANFAANFDTGEIYFPGGATGTLANHFLAARGDCALVAGVLPSSCTVNANGSIQEGSSATIVPDATNDIARNIENIHENAGLVGASARPTDKLWLNADLIFGYNDKSSTRISPRQLQSYKIQARYSPTPWSNITGSVDIHENRDNVAMVNNVEHGRAYSFLATVAPNAKLWVDFGYTFMDVYTQTEICFPDTGSTIFTALCPVPGATSPLGTLSSYSSKEHYASGDMMWKPYQRVTAMLGYSGTIVRGNTTFLNPLTPTGTLDFNYLRPSVSLAFEIYKGWTYKTAWNYYGYGDRGVPNPAGLAAVPLQDFNGSNITFSMRYAF